LHQFIGQVIGFDYSTFTGFHPAMGQIHHAIREVITTSAQAFFEQIEEFEENLKMIILFIGHDVNHALWGQATVALVGCAQVLGHVNGSSIGTEEQFFIQAIATKITPHRAIIFFKKRFFIQRV